MADYSQITILNLSNKKLTELQDLSKYTNLNFYFLFKFGRK